MDAVVRKFEEKIEKKKRKRKRRRNIKNIRGKNRGMVTTNKEQKKYIGNRTTGLTSQ
ncbi:hypothetical protein PP707_03035 [Acetobacter pasteurianus]|nr:hypothetical protein [Acetobacter pasteurianus]